MMHWRASVRDGSRELSYAARAQVLVDQKPESPITGWYHFAIALTNCAKGSGVVRRANGRSDADLNILILGATNADCFDIGNAATSIIQVLNLVDASGWNVDCGAGLDRIAVTIDETRAGAFDDVDHFFACQIAPRG